jgi:hypothetical protein
VFPAPQDYPTLLRSAYTSYFFLFVSANFLSFLHAFPPSPHSLRYGSGSAAFLVARTDGLTDVVHRKSDVYSERYTKTLGAWASIKAADRRQIGRESNVKVNTLNTV